MLQTRVALALVAVLLAACARGAGSPGTVSTPTPSPSPTATPSPTVTPRPTPSPAPSLTPVATPSPTPDSGTDAPALAHGELAEVLIDGLNVREAAGETSPVITISFGDYDNLHTAPLQLDSGERVLILDGPVAAGGRWWFRLATGDPLMPPQSVFIGWSAAGTVSDPWLSASTECAPNPDVKTLSTMRYVERLGCYGSDSLTFDAIGVRFPPSAGMGGACQTEPGAPIWLLCDNVNYSYVRPVDSESEFFLLHFDPNGSQPWVDPLTLQDVPVRITGHHADPAAEDCGIGLEEPAAEVFRIQCATLFVVDSLTVIQ